MAEHEFIYLIGWFQKRVKPPNLAIYPEIHMALYFRRITGVERPIHFQDLGIEVVFKVTASDGRQYFFSSLEEAARWARNLHQLDLDEDSPRQQHPAVLSR